MPSPTIPNQALLNGLNPLAYMGVRPTSPNLFLVESRNPTINDKNFALGTLWMNNNSPFNLYFLANLNQGIATWVPISTSSSGTVDTLTSNTGGPVPALAGNINVVGDGITITGVGNPGTNTITFETLGTGVVSDLTGNSGGAISPLAGNINVVGDGTTVNVVGNPATHTLTISAVGTGTVETLTSNTGGAVSPLAGNINVVGDGVTIFGVGNPGTHTITLSATGTTILTYTNVTTSPYVVLTTDDYLSVNTASAITVQLPNAPGTGRVFYIKDRTGNAASNNITVTTVGGVVTIDGSTSYVMNTAFEAISVIFGTSGYEVF